MLEGWTFEDLRSGASKVSLFGGFRRARAFNCGCRGLSRSADGGFADENGSGFDRESLCFDVADDFATGLEFDAVGGGDVAVNFAVNHDSRGFDFGFDPGVFTDSEVSLRVDFTFNFTIDHKVIGKFDDTFDFHVGGEDIASCGRSLACGGVGRLR